MNKSYVLILLFILLLAACVPATIEEPIDATPTIEELTPVPQETNTPTLGPSATFPPPPMPSSTPKPTIVLETSEEARLYIDQALDIMQTYALNRNRIDWKRLRERVQGLARPSQTIADTYRAIQFALGSLEDGHSYLIPADEVQLLLIGELDAGLKFPQGSPLVDGRLAYLELPGIMGSSQAEEAYAVELQRLIFELDVSKPCGWVIDLRNNSGGNMWAMLAGIGPVLGEGLAGSFVYPDGNERYWYYAMGRSLLNDETQIGIDNHIPYQLADLFPLTAVLTGPGTMSSGEALVVAFKTRDNSRIFGQDTAGLTNASSTFVLSDGSWIQLAVALLSDRQGRLYDGPISPDEFVPPGSDTVDFPLQTAIEWLLKQSECIK